VYYLCCMHYSIKSRVDMNTYHCYSFFLDVMGYTACNHVWWLHPAEQLYLINWHV